MAARASTQAGVQVCQQRGHLCVVETAIEGRHHPFAGQDTRRTSASVAERRWEAWRLLKTPCKIGRNFLRGQIVVFVTMRAATFVEMLPFCLLRRERLGVCDILRTWNEMPADNDENWKRALMRSSHLILRRGGSVCWSHDASLSGSRSARPRMFSIATCRRLRNTAGR